MTRSQIQEQTDLTSRCRRLNQISLRFDLFGKPKQFACNRLDPVRLCTTRTGLSRQQAAPSRMRFRGTAAFEFNSDGLLL